MKQIHCIVFFQIQYLQILGQILFTYGLSYNACIPPQEILRSIFELLLEGVLNDVQLHIIRHYSI